MINSIWWNGVVDKFPDADRLLPKLEHKYLAQMGIRLVVIVSVYESLTDADAEILEYAFEKCKISNLEIAKPK